MHPSLDKFGKFFVQNSRDKMLHDLEMLLQNHWKDDDAVKLQSQLSSFTEEQKDILRSIIERITTGGMHDLLFAIQTESDLDGAIRVNVDGIDVAQITDGLHGEIFGDEGWIVRFSHYPSPTEIERSMWAEDWIKKTFSTENPSDAEPAA